MIFLRNFFNWLTSCNISPPPQPPPPPPTSQTSRSLPELSGVIGNKIQPFYRKYKTSCIAELTSFAWSNSSYQNFHVLHFFSRRSFAFSLWYSLLTRWKVFWTKKYTISDHIITSYIKSKKNRNLFHKSIFYSSDVSDVFLQSLFKL